jgi:predicted ribosome quality control (RQC) complex YloA/Tae2 family protein
MRLSKNEKKAVNEVIRDVFAQSKSYQEVLDKMKEIKAKKLQLEHEIRGQFVKEIEKMEKIAESLSADAELLSDLALSKLMKGETVEITDENDVTYEPVFKVSFKKAK